MISFSSRSWIKKGWEYFKPFHSWAFSSRDTALLAVSLIFYSVSFLPSATTYIALPLAVCIGFGFYRFQQGKRNNQAFSLFICLISFISALTNATDTREVALAFFSNSHSFFTRTWNCSSLVTFAICCDSPGSPFKYKWTFAGRSLFCSDISLVPSYCMAFISTSE